MITGVEEGKGKGKGGLPSEAKGSVAARGCWARHDNGWVKILIRMRGYK